MKNSGKYFYVGSPSVFGAKMKTAESIKALKLSLLEKTDIKNGNALLFTSRNDIVIRINTNGTIR
jgi:hypothetical protein